MKTNASKLFIIVAIGMFFVGAIKGQPNNFVNNQTTLQSPANFNIDGIGTAGVFNAAIQYNIGGIRLLTVVGDRNFFAGLNAGTNNTTGIRNSFFGENAGAANTTGSNNSFFGNDAGVQSTTGHQNSFFGVNAGKSNTTGLQNAFFGSVAGENATSVQNSFFGFGAGRFTTIGAQNSFFGNQAGLHNTSGHANTFVGALAGKETTTGIRNSFFGNNTGATNLSGSNNTLIGREADVGSGGLIFATAIGAEAVVSSSNTIQLGRANGSDTVNISGSLQVGIFGAGTGPLCRTRKGIISNCVSSIRYKSNVKDFSPGLSLIKRLRPVSFNWKDGNMLDLGLIAEEVEKIEPLLVTKDKEGVVQGVKYNRIGVVLINAVQEQQKLIAKQRAEINALKRLVCSDHQTAAICR